MCRVNPEGLSRASKEPVAYQRIPCRLFLAFIHHATLTTTIIRGTERILVKGRTSRVRIRYVERVRHRSPVRPSVQRVINGRKEARGISTKATDRAGRPKDGMWLVSERHERICALSCCISSLCGVPHFWTSLFLPVYPALNIASVRPVLYLIPLEFCPANKFSITVLEMNYRLTSIALYLND